MEASIYSWKYSLPKHKISFMFFVVLAISTGLVYIYCERFMYIYALGWGALLAIILTNLYSFRKYFIFPLYRKWKRVILPKKENFEQAQYAFHHLQKEIDRGTLTENSKIIEQGDYLLEKNEIGDIYKAKIMTFGDEKRVRIVKRKALGKLDRWFRLHVYFGWLALLMTLFHAEFSPGGTFFTQALFFLTFIILFSGLTGIFIVRYSPMYLVSIEQRNSLENLEFLESILLERLQKISQDRSTAFRKTLKKLRRLLTKNSVPETLNILENMIQQVPDDEHDAFKKAQICACQYHQLHFRLIRLQRYRQVHKIWMYIHIPLSALFIIFSILHIGNMILH